MLNKERKGFTLIELMIVVAIIGILAAIAIPQFNAYRIRGYNASAVSGLKNAATSMEAYYGENDAYLPSQTLSAASNLTGWTPDSSVTIAITVPAAGTSWTGTAYHAKGDKTWTWNSANGGCQNCPK
jgi:prepilin-type N-terminal cleavage/methylation domain